MTPGSSVIPITAETHPGATPDADAFAKGWREGVRQAWLAIKQSGDVVDARRQIADLGNKGLGK